MPPKVKCPQCGIAVLKHNLPNHLKIHSRQFKCDLCPYSTTSQELLDTHVVKKHANIDSIETGTNGSVEVIDASSKNLKSVAGDDTHLMEVLLPFQHFLRESVLRQKHQNIYNFPILEQTNDEIEQCLRKVFEDLTSTAKNNFSFGYVLRNTDESVADRYFYAHNNNTVFSSPIVLSDENDLKFIVDEIDGESFFEIAKAERPNTSWRLLKVTKVTFFVKLLQIIPLGQPAVIPSFLLRNRSVITFTRHPFNKKPLNDSLCAFRALAYHKCMTNEISKAKFNEETTSLLTSYLRHKELDAKNFRGVKVSDLSSLEDVTRTNITVYDVEKTDEKVIGTLVHRSMKKYSSEAVLVRCDRHLCYVTKPQSFFHKYRCIHCSTFSPFPSRLDRHQKTCTALTKEVYPGGVYKLSNTVFEDLEEWDIFVPENERLYKYFAIFDFESICNDFHPLPNTSATTWIGSHVPISVSICSNMFPEPVFICDEDPKTLVVDFMDELERQCHKVAEVMFSKHEKYFKQLEKLIKILTTEIESKFSENLAEDDEFAGWYSEFSFDSEKEKKRQLTSLKSLRERYIRYLSVFPVLGFSSSRFDLNLIKYWLLTELVEKKKIKVHVIKKTNQFLSLEFNSIIFLDILNFLGGCTTLDSFLKAYKTTETKGFFPYEWLKDYSQLNETTLPPPSAFYSKLENCNLLNVEIKQFQKLLRQGLTETEALSKLGLRNIPHPADENHKYLLNLWRNQNMKNMKDFLRWYNNKDVVPTMEAFQKMLSFYHSQQIDMLKLGLTLPCLSNRILHKSAPFLFYVFGENDIDLSELVRDNIVGGPSIVFTRAAKAGITNIKNTQNVCELVVGWNCAQLYPHAMTNLMPTGSPVRYDFCEVLQALKRRPNSKSELEDHVLTHIQSQRKDCKIIYYAKHGFQKRIGPYFVDGFCEHCNSVFEVMGCYFHFCSCMDSKWIGELYDKMISKRDYDEKRRKYLETKGYNVRTYHECSWRKQIRENAEVRDFIVRHFPRKKMIYTSKELLDAIRKDQVFGMIEVDIEVPDKLKSYFADFPPIFKNTYVERENIGEFMKNVAEDQNLLKKPTKMLTSSFFLEKGLLITPLLRFYLEKGLVVTKIYQFVQNNPKVCFKDFVESVVDARRKGDENPDSAVVAETMKLFGNSSYGYQIMNRGRRTNTGYYHDGNIASAINSKRFRIYSQVSEGVFEVTSAKPKIEHKEPIVIGLFILQYAKLRMNELVYNFIKPFFDDNLYEFIQMDTDSLYMQVARKSFRELIRPEKLAEWDTLRRNDCAADLQFKADSNKNFFPRECCLRHKQFDKRTPGLFKEELRGTACIALCSKTHCVYDKDTDNTKVSCKGLNKAPILNDETESPLAKYQKVMDTKQNYSSTNRGFKFYDGFVKTYTQFKKGLSYFYPKRRVDKDGVHTSPLDI